jgi:hypothetical protein
VCWWFAPRGQLSGDRLLAPEGKAQPNEGEGVKVESTCVQSSGFKAISPHGRWVVAHQVLVRQRLGDRQRAAWVRFEFPFRRFGRQADRPDRTAFWFAGQRSGDRQRVPTARLDKARYKKLNVRCLASPCGIKVWKVRLLSAPRGVVSGDRLLAPEGEAQPNEGKGVKAGKFGRFFN